VIEAAGYGSYFNNRTGHSVARRCMESVSTSTIAKCATKGN
jgi:hypothetical protein